MWLVVEFDEKSNSITNIAKVGFPSSEEAYGYIDLVKSNRLLGEWADVNLKAIELPTMLVDVSSEELHIDNVIPVFAGFDFTAGEDED